jgi:hypothetical protein
MLSSLPGTLVPKIGQVFEYTILSKQNLFRTNFITNLQTRCEMYLEIRECLASDFNKRSYMAGGPRGVSTCSDHPLYRLTEAKRPEIFFCFLNRLLQK